MLTGSDATTVLFSVLDTTSLGVLYVVVTVVPSLVVVVPPPFRKGLPSGKSSMGMMFTGSDASMMCSASALLEWSRYTTGLAMVVLLQIRAKTMAQESRGR